MKLLFACIITFTGLLFLQCNRSTGNNGDIKKSSVKLIGSTDLNAAEAHYKEYCGGCHGENLRTFVDRDWVHGTSKEAMFTVIKNGVVDAGMPAYDTTFTDQEIYDLIAYIQNGIEAVQEFKASGKTVQKVYQSKGQTYTIDTILSGLDIPWGLAFLPDGGFLYTERSGNLYLKLPDKAIQQVPGTPTVRNKGQGGLLDVELHPDFANNRYIYLAYSKPNPDGSNTQTTAIQRAKLTGNQLTEQEDIFIAQPYVKTSHHYGSRIEFDQIGYLFFSVGDRGRRDEHPQSLGNHCGKIHRIKDDGSIPPDNPFVDTEGALPSIWSYGHRNPQGLALHLESGIMWEHEHGPKGGDEVNIIGKGKNYGWPVISYGVNYSGTKFTDITKKEGMEQPEIYWVPSIAPCGGTFTDSDVYPGWKGDFMVGSLRFNYVNRCIVENGKIIGEEKILEDIGRVRNVETDRNGYLYVAVEDPGMIYRIVPVKD